MQILDLNFFYVAKLKTNTINSQNLGSKTLIFNICIYVGSEEQDPRHIFEHAHQ